MDAQKLKAFAGHGAGEGSGKGGATVFEIVLPERKG